MAKRKDFGKSILRATCAILPQYTTVLIVGQYDVHM